jgi:hypothetical protein|tara:strand:+ start:76 stop:303 length:228 start_codon:yes stop_codon:yes gene_type:complete
MTEPELHIAPSVDDTTPEDKVQALKIQLKERIMVLENERINAIAAQDPSCQRLLGRIEGIEEQIPKGKADEPGTD